MRNAFSEKLDRLSPGHVTAKAMFRTDSTKSTLIPPDSLVLIFSGMTNLQPAVLDLDWHWGPSQLKLGTNRGPSFESSLMATLIEDCAS
jgi:hypothetical protein